MTFIGEYTAKLDDKGRLIFPSEFRAQAGTLNMQFVIRKHSFRDALEMFSLDEWRKYSDEVKSKLNLSTKEGSEVWEWFNRTRTIVTPDEKMGRIMIPKHLLEKIKVVKEVVFTGLDSKIQIWAKENWEGQAMNDEDFADRFEKLMS